MDRAQFQRIKSLFEQALELDESGRKALLDRECGDDDALRGEVESLLALPTESAGMERLQRAVEKAIDPAGSQATATGVPNAVDPTKGARIGPYRLLEKIGEGGMGEVWIADQSGPVRRRVALKIIKRGMDSDRVVTRFEAERQALAVMDHPAIAKIFDAGRTAEGRPYFAMEYIEGVPITEYCDRHTLNMRGRLELFMKVCDGVQHAHQKAVIHRDLKPSNILVTVRDGRAEPRIIDFGVAKATAHRLTEKTLYTELGVLIGTPAYMSPEQAGLTGENIDTRTDVYALGVLLYELLTGVLPFDPRELREAGIEEIVRRLREVEPPRPSLRLASLPGDSSSRSAKNRRSSPATLTRQILGDLDWITMKALEKDRTRRYGSPSDLAMDVGRYLADEPVLAGPPSGIYRAKKFVKRHRVGVGVAALTSALVLAFAVVTNVQSRRIAREASAAQQMSAFLVELFRVSDPSESRGNTITAREILDRGAEKLETELADQPEIQARMMHTIGRVYESLGLKEPARRLLQRAADNVRAQLGDEHPKALLALNDLANVIMYQGEYAEAAAILESVLEARSRVLGPEDPDTLRTTVDLVRVYHRLGRLDEAERLGRRAFDLYRSRLGDDDSRTWWAAAQLAKVLRARKLDAEAEPLNRQILTARVRILGEDHPATIQAQDDLAGVLLSRGRVDEAGALIESALAYNRRVYGEESPRVVASLNNLAVIRKRQRDYDGAETLYKKAIEIGARVDGPDHLETLFKRDNLAMLYRDTGRFEAAEREARSVMEAARRGFGSGSSNALKFRRSLARILGKAGKMDEAVSHYLEVVSGYRELYGSDDWHSAETLFDLGYHLKQAGELEDAVRYYQLALKAQIAARGAEHPRTLGTAHNIGLVFVKLGRYDDAQRLFHENYEIAARVLGPTHSQTALEAAELGRVHAIRGERAEALEWLRLAVDAGFDNVRWLTERADLQSLADEPAFREIVRVAGEGS